MFCGQCGKRVLDTMLFCPFCGSPIVIPDQDEPEPAAREAQEPAPEATPAKPEVSYAAAPEAKPAKAQEAQKAAPAAPKPPVADAIFEVQGESAHEETIDEEIARMAGNDGGARDRADAAAWKSLQAEPTPISELVHVGPGSNPDELFFLAPDENLPRTLPACEEDLPKTEEASPAEASAVDTSPEEASPEEASAVDTSPVEASAVEASPMDAGSAAEFQPLRFDEPEPPRTPEPPSYDKPEPPRFDEPMSPRMPEPFREPEPPREETRQEIKIEGGQPARPDSPRSLFDISEDEEEPSRASRERRPAASGPRRPSPQQRRSADGARPPRPSYIPVKDVDPNDMFMDASHPDRMDGFDPYDEDGVEDFGEDFSYEEPERGSFLQRHIRGIVGLVLLAMVLVIFLIWAAMPQGQRALASMNLAWNPKVYDDLGHDAYEAGQYRQAASYFKSALARDEDNYEYAHSAMVAYYEDKDIDAALAMLKRCIQMDPSNAEPYHELMILYPDPSTRPFEVTELLRDGYARTGDEALNPAAAEPTPAPSTGIAEPEATAVSAGGAVQGNPMLQWVQQ